MILDVKEIKLKNGKTCILRTPRKEDGAAVLEYMSRNPKLAQTRSMRESQENDLSKKIL